jgi:transaldolase/transaldolase/glucose-6-phosphate isomerase
MTKIHELQKLGQSIWYDNISRGMLKSGEIQALIDQGVRGMTSNPTIFEKAISSTTDYDASIQTLVTHGYDAPGIFESLAFDDIRAAADLLMPVYESSGGEDGFISLEVSPDLARDANGTLETARRYWNEVERSNLMIKIPATPECIPAIEAAISDGLNINITLMFSLAHYEAVTQAYISGLEKLAASGGDVSKVASVASFFVSRVDGKVDPLVEAKGRTDLMGKIAIANAKLTYARFKEIFSGDRWEKLASAGARVQRPLWASTSTKNPAYPDTLYVDTLIGAHTVNTVPSDTLEAILDHASVTVTVENGVDEAQAQINELASLGIDFDAVTEALQVEGVDKFADSFNQLLASIQAKVPA